MSFRSVFFGGWLCYMLRDNRLLIASHILVVVVVQIVYRSFIDSSIVVVFRRRCHVNEMIRSKVDIEYERN